MTKRYTDEQDRQWQKTLPKKKVAVKVIVKSNEDNILLVKPDYKDTWRLLGGGVEANEDPKLAAIRESKEEADIDISLVELKIIDTVFKSNEDDLILIYEYKKTVDENADYSVEDEEYKFVSPSDIAKLLPDYYKGFWNTYIS